MQAAHDAAQGLGPGLVGDHRHVAVERVFLVVERHQRLAGLGQAQAEIALDGVGVEDVQRPVEADSEKVGDVDQGRDWSESDGQQADFEPIRAFRVGDAAHGAADEVGAGVAGRVVKVQMDGDGAGETAGYRLDAQGS